jgi:hypothetical protein
MKKIILSVFCLALLSACSNQNAEQSATETEVVTAASEVAPEKVPVFKFVKETFDFGEITEGEKVTYDFKFTNAGESPLIITSATATCGCTVPEYPKEPIAPGEEGVIKVVYNSANNLGMQNKVVTITANTIPEITQVNILGNVVKPVTAAN